MEDILSERRVQLSEEEKEALRAILRQKREEEQELKQLREELIARDFDVPLSDAVLKRLNGLIKEKLAHNGVADHPELSVAQVYDPNSVQFRRELRAHKRAVAPRDSAAYPAVVDLPFVPSNPTAFDVVSRQQQVVSAALGIDIENLREPMQELLLSRPPDPKHNYGQKPRFEKSQSEKEAQSIALLDYYQRIWQHYPNCQTGKKYNFQQPPLDDDQSFDLEEEEW